MNDNDLTEGVMIDIFEDPEWDHYYFEVINDPITINDNQWV